MRSIMKRARKARNRIWLYEDNELHVSLSDEAQTFLQGLDEVVVAPYNGVNLMFSHFCYPDFSGSAIYFPRDHLHLQKHFDYMSGHGCVLSVSGHGHPEGVLIADTGSFRQAGFGRHRLADEEPGWLVAPCVARTSRKNGVLILDTASCEVTALPLPS